VIGSNTKTRRKAAERAKRKFPGGEAMNVYISIGIAYKTK